MHSRHGGFPFPYDPLLTPCPLWLLHIVIIEQCALHSTLRQIQLKAVHESAGRGGVEAVGVEWARAEEEAGRVSSWTQIANTNAFVPAYLF